MSNPNKVSPFIQNIGYGDIEKGLHYDAGPNSMLIQIIDPGAEVATPKKSFKEKHVYFFLDLDDSDIYPEDVKISDVQAQQIVANLQHALDNDMNVIVHCTAGVCRSGAVTEVGVMMGFCDAFSPRIPNLRVKHKMMKTLGWTYDPEESPYAKGANEEWL